MDGPIALAHGPEGAGNATRVMAVAEELRRAGVEVALAGGGSAAQYVELNGFEEFAPTGLDFIRMREVEGTSLLAALRHAAPRMRRRARQFGQWLSGIDPDVLLTDDPAAAVPATIRNIPWYRLDHSSVRCYSDWFARVVYRGFNRASLRLAETFFYTTVFSDPYPGEPNLRAVGPIAHEPQTTESVESFDVLLVPSTYAAGYGELADRLRAEGYSVRLVGGPDWEPVPAILPYFEAAQIAVTSGFSATSEALVAGTPCINWPFLDCQRGIAREIDEQGIDGIQVGHSLESVLEAVADPPATPDFENGAPVVAEQLRAYAE